MASGSVVAGAVVVTCISSPVDHIYMVYAIVNLIFSVATAVTLVVADEAKPKPSTDRGTLWGQVQQLYPKLRDSPVDLKWTLLLQFGASLAVFCVAPIYSVWMGVVIYGGDPVASPGSPANEAYQQGLQTFATASIVQVASLDIG